MKKVTISMIPKMTASGMLSMKRSETRERSFVVGGEDTMLTLLHLELLAQELYPQDFQNHR